MIWRVTEKSLKRMYKNKCYLDPLGYYRFKSNKKLVHRWIMEKILDRRLKNYELIHHINGIKSDNRPSNLLLFNSEEEHENWHLEQLHMSNIW